LLDFATHLAACADCRIAWSLSADFAGSAGPVPGDERIVGRAAKAALAFASPPRVSRRLVHVATAAAAMLVVAGVASAAIALHGKFSGATHDRSPPPAPPPARHAAVPSRSTWQASLPAPSPPPSSTTETAPGEQDPSPTAAPAALDLPRRTVPAARAAVARPPSRVALAPGSPRLEPQPLAPQEPSTTRRAQVALAEAVRARGEGRLPEAIASFRALQGQFAGTPEALVSAVSLGDLLLRTGAAAEALRSFDEYLRSAPADAALVPEALTGRARALTSLGQREEGEATWRELARRFPASPYAGRAARIPAEGTAQ
jgi:TolA-binding protein